MVPCPKTRWLPRLRLEPAPHDDAIDGEETGAAVPGPAAHAHDGLPHRDVPRLHARLEEPPLVWRHVPRPQGRHAHVLVLRDSRRRRDPGAGLLRLRDDRPAPHEGARPRAPVRGPEHPRAAVRRAPGALPRRHGGPRLRPARLRVGRVRARHRAGLPGRRAPPLDLRPPRGPRGRRAADAVRQQLPVDGAGPHDQRPGRHEAVALRAARAHERGLAQRHQRRLRDPASCGRDGLREPSTGNAKDHR